MAFEETPALENARVRLEPLAERQAGDLADAVAVGDPWRTWYTHIPAPEVMSVEIDRRLELQRGRRMAPWAVVDVDSSRAVGMTIFCNVDPANRRLEIGSTWLGRAAQGTGLNAAAKLLLLTRAFDDLDCMAIEFRAHWHNHQSRAAIARLGAKQDGVLRKHTLFENGTVRDTVAFSRLPTTSGRVCISGCRPVSGSTRSHEMRLEPLLMRRAAQASLISVVPLKQRACRPAHPRPAMAASSGPSAWPLPETAIASPDAPSCPAE